MSPSESSGVSPEFGSMRNLIPTEGGRFINPIDESAQRRVQELEALARISEAVSESLYLEESLEAIVKSTMETLRALAISGHPDLDGRLGQVMLANPDIDLSVFRQQVSRHGCSNSQVQEPHGGRLLQKLPQTGRGW